MIPFANGCRAEHVGSIRIAFDIGVLDETDIRPVGSAYEGENEITPTLLYLRFIAALIQSTMNGFIIMWDWVQFPERSGPIPRL